MQHLYSNRSRPLLHCNSLSEVASQGSGGVLRTRRHTVDVCERSGAMNSMKMNSLRLTSTGCLLALLATGPTWAQTPAPTPPPGPTPEEGGSANGESLSSLGSKITIHGFLSQAYARTDGSQILGIPKQGTADYRTAALQVRADITPSDTFAIQ